MLWNKFLFPSSTGVWIFYRRHFLTAARGLSRYVAFATAVYFEALLNWPQLSFCYKNGWLHFSLFEELIGKKFEANCNSKQSKCGPKVCVQACRNLLILKDYALNSGWNDYIIWIVFRLQLRTGTMLDQGHLCCLYGVIIILFLSHIYLWWFLDMSELALNFLNVWKGEVTRYSYFSWVHVQIWSCMKLLQWPFSYMEWVFFPSVLVGALGWGLEGRC